MRHIFADTFFWIALLSPRDSAHAHALAMANTLEEIVLVTTDEVLNEFLTQIL